VTLILHDVRGRVVRTIVEGERAAGEHRAEVDASELPAGVYFYRLEAPGVRSSKPCTLIQ
jgi:hypothetical protein